MYRITLPKVDIGLPLSVSKAILRVLPLKNFANVKYRLAKKPFTAQNLLLRIPLIHSYWTRIKMILFVSANKVKANIKQES
jgi:hypothetical protein